GGDHESSILFISTIKIERGHSFIVASFIFILLKRVDLSTDSRSQERNMKRMLILLLVMLTGCSVAGLPPGPHVQFHPTCPPLEEPSLKDAKLIVLGEMHGTAESPAFAWRVVCSIAERSEVVFLIEAPASAVAPLIESAEARKQSVFEDHIRA